MPMEAKVHSLLKEKLADTKVAIDGTEVSLVEAIVGWYDKHEAAVQIQNANKDLTSQREHLEKEIKKLKSELKTSEEEIERYRKSQLTDEDKAKFAEWKKKGMTPEIEALVNSLNAKLDEQGKKIAELEKAKADNEAAVAQAKREKMESDLRTDITNALAGQKITGNNAKLALNTILAEKLVTFNDKGERVLTVYKDGKPFKVDSLEALAKEFATQHENLVDSSGNRGHNTPPPPNNQTSSYRRYGNDQGLAALRNEALDMLDMPSRR